MTIYEKNLEALAGNQAKGLQRYQQVREKGDYTKIVLSIEAKESRDGHLVMTVATETGKARLNSPYYSQKEAVKWADQYEFGNIESVMIMFGLGNGVFVEELLARMQQDATLVLYEPSFQVFEWVMEHIDLTTILSDRRVLLYVNEVNGDYIEDGLDQVLDWANFGVQMYGYHTGYEVLFQEEYLVFLKKVRHSQDMVQVNVDTNYYFSKENVENILNNLKYLQTGRSITGYVGKIPEGVPVIIVSAGPSLDKNIELLKEAKGRSFIIATDTAVRHLIKHNIVPDAMATLDAKKPTDYISNPVVKDVPMFCALTSNYRIMEFHQGIKIWFNTDGFLEQLVTKYEKVFPKYNPGGSVATAAFAIAVALKTNMIVLMGQDLAYSGGVTHAGGEVSSIMNEAEGQQWIEGIDGSSVKSRHDWIMYRDWFQDAIRDVKDRIRVIDATEGGAKIEGAEIMTLRQVLDQHCTQRVCMSEILQAEMPMFTPKEYDQLSAELLRFPQDIVAVQKSAEQAKSACDKLLKLLSSHAEDGQMLKYIKKMKRENEKMEDKMVYFLLDMYTMKESCNYLTDVFRVADRAEKDEYERNLYQNTLAFYRNLINAAKELYPLVDNIIARDIAK